jgi:serine/threonine-protein kinase
MLAQPHRLGRYELLARLATGGMGEIFLARLEGVAGFEKLYVVKRILPHLADDARFRQMLIAEARIASKLSHANICQVYELGETDGQLYIVMEYLDGVTVLPLLRRASKQHGALDLGLVAGVLQQTTDALHYAHELKDRGDSLGIVHRDVTPSNVFLTESGITKVLDFGIAKAKGASTQTQEGTIKGKYAYMAPEQLRGGDIDRRVDIFALGVVVYEMLALRRLFQRKTDYLTFRAVMEQPIPDIRRYRPDVPEALVFVLARALDRDPDNRFDTARQFGTALLDAIGGRPWSQGELSDFVRATFSEQLGRRSQEVHNAVARTAVASGARLTMPLIGPSEVEDHEDDGGDDDGFPSVETDLDEAPPWHPAPTPRAASQPADFITGTPPPFGIEPTSSKGEIKPLVGAQVATGNQAAQPAPRRSLLWPVVAIGMLGIAGAALFLVWQQQQRQQPTSVVITQTTDPRRVGEIVVPPPAPPSPAAPVAPVAADPPDPGPGPGPGPEKKTSVASPPPRHPVVAGDAAYQAAIEAELPKLGHCLSEHPDPPMPSDASVTIDIAKSGKPLSVALHPDGLAATPLGQCLKNVLRAISFPKAAASKIMTVPISKT